MIQKNFLHQTKCKYDTLDLESFSESSIMIWNRATKEGSELREMMKKEGHVDNSEFSENSEISEFVLRRIPSSELSFLAYT